MRKIRLVVVGKTQEKYFQAAEADYLKRIRRYAAVETTIIKPEKIAGGKTDQQIKSAEIKRINDALNGNEYRIVLARTGKKLSSEQLAAFMQKAALNQHSKLTFIIGGPLGLTPEFEKGCDFQLSLSAMTFTHDMSRVILMEQIYRAFSILNNEKYHK